jgi:A/G-specific adenine glycosylase
VNRVIPFFNRWVKELPDWTTLAKAPTKLVLKLWSGLGYNRRALYLRDMAKSIMERHNGKLPKNPEQLRELPGIGPYTARSILIFGFNAPITTIDTNIRKVLIHELKLSPKTCMQNLEKIARAILPAGRSRDWHNALMDWAAAKYPKQHPHIKPLSRQSRFDGSLRQIRGSIVRLLTQNNSTDIKKIQCETKRSAADIAKAIDSLQKDGLIIKSNSRYRLA